jgi:diketogulonate reductase-like aldo/keto reductase
VNGIEDTIELNNGSRIPRLGLGVYQIPKGAPTEQAVTWALQAGYRHIDTAKLYRNEASVGSAIRTGPLPREDVWVTTKLWVTDELWAPRAFAASLARLGLGYVDLYLVHFPAPGLVRRTWRAMESILRAGHVRAIGVSNHSAAQLRSILDTATVPPCLNQVRCSPFDYDRPLHEFCRENGIAFEAYSPLTRGRRLQDQRLVAIAQHYGRSTSEVLIRWALQKGMVVIPKSSNEQRIGQNAGARDFALSEEDMSSLDSLSSRAGTGSA